jgi:hypothetical protein
MLRARFLQTCCSLLTSQSYKVHIVSKIICLLKVKRDPPVVRDIFEAQVMVNPKVNPGHGTKLYVAARVHINDYDRIDLNSSLFDIAVQVVTHRRY